MLQLLKTVVVVSALVSCGDKTEQGAPVSRVAIRNQATAPVSVNVVSADESATMAFTDVAVDTASGFQTADFSPLTGVSVNVAEHLDMSGTLDLTAGRDNTIVLSTGALPTVLVTINPNEGTGGGW